MWSKCRTTPNKCVWVTSTIADVFCFDTENLKVHIAISSFFFGADWMASMSSPIRSTFYWLLYTLYIDWFWWSTHWDDFFSDHVDPNPIKIDWVLHQYLSQLVVLVTLWYHFSSFWEARHTIPIKWQPFWNRKRIEYPNDNEVSSFQY